MWLMQPDTEAVWEDWVGEEDSELEEESSGTEGTCDERDEPETTDNALSRYLREVARYPLLTAQEEGQLALEIRASRGRLVDLLLKLPFTFEEIDQIRAMARADKNDEQKRAKSREDLIDKALRRLREREEEILEDENLRGLLNQIRETEAKVRDLTNRMALSNLRLVFHISKNFLNRGLPLLDLVQEGNIGLLKAVARFDPERGARFSTYATWWIQQAIRRGIEEKGRTIRVPAHMVGALNRCRQTVNSVGEPSEGLPFEKVMEETRLPLRHLEVLLNHIEEPISLETPVKEGKERLIDVLPDEDPLLATEVAMQKELSESLRQTLKAMLSRREEKIIRQRFGIEHKKEYTLGEVGRQLGISRERVRQIENKALMKLRRAKTEVRRGDKL